MADEIPLSSPVKTAVIEALDKYLADKAAEINRIRNAIVADLPGVSAAGLSIEAIVGAEVAKLHADVKPLWKRWTTYAAAGGASAAGGVTAWLVHLLA